MGHDNWFERALELREVRERCISMSCLWAFGLALNYGERAFREDRMEKEKEESGMIMSLSLSYIVPTAHAMWA